MAAFLATISSLLWGASDFLGGTLSRRSHPIAVMRTTQAMAAAGLVLIVVLAGEVGRTGAIPAAAAAGVTGFIGLGAFYAALATGTMGVVAPIAATGVVIPVALGLAQGDSPTPLQVAGIVATIAGVVMASGPERASRAESVPGPTGEPEPDVTVRSILRHPLLLAGVAAVAFGCTIALVAAGSESSVVMTLLTMRVVNVAIGSVLLLTVIRGVARPPVRELPALAFVAASDAGANGTFALASTMGQVSIAAVLASFYPAVTAVLAWRFHGERLSPVQVAGVAATLAGVALIAAG